MDRPRSTFDDVGDKTVIKNNDDISHTKNIITHNVNRPRRNVTKPAYLNDYLYGAVQDEMATRKVVVNSGEYYCFPCKISSSENVSLIVIINWRRCKQSMRGSK